MDCDDHPLFTLFGFLYSTFVCPTEIISFSDKANEFHDINCEVVGVSVDSHFTHLAWTNTPRKVQLMPCVFNLVCGERFSVNRDIPSCVICIIAPCHIRVSFFFFFDAAYSIDLLHKLCIKLQKTICINNCIKFCVVQMFNSLSGWIGLLQGHPLCCLSGITIASFVILGKRKDFLKCLQLPKLVLLIPVDSTRGWPGTSQSISPIFSAKSLICIKLSKNYQFNRSI